MGPAGLYNCSGGPLTHVIIPGDTMVPWGPCGPCSPWGLAGRMAGGWLRSKLEKASKGQVLDEPRLSCLVLFVLTLITDYQSKIE